MSLRNMKTTAANDGKPSADAVDWKAKKAEILAGLDLLAEYEALGVVFEPGQPRPSNWLACRAVGRPPDNPDEVPSAAVNLATGVYKDSGNGGVVSSFWEFALAHGKFGSYGEVLKHYAQKAGVSLGGSPIHGRIREATYDYHEPDGTVRYRVARYRLPNGRKAFSQHPRDGMGGWKQGAGCMDGILPLPYRLPELLASAADDGLVFVVEGEQDADRLRAAGLIATTSHGGTGGTHSTWPRFDPAWFAGRRCCVLPDADEAGRKHAARVAAWLGQSEARSIRLLELPGLGPHGDASDWLDAGGTVAELLTLVEHAPEWRPDQAEAAAEAEAEPTPPRRLAHLGDVRQLNTDVRWIWPGWLPAARIAGLASLEGCGKTRLMLDLGRRIWHALPWPDGQPPTFPAGTPTLWICADGNQDDLLEAAEAMDLPDEAIVLSGRPDDPYANTDLDSGELLQTLDEFIPIVKPALVIVDTLTNATRRDLCRQSDVQIVMTPIKELAIRHRVTFVPQVHLSKDGVALGRRIRGFTRTLLHLTCPDPTDLPNRRRLWVEKSINLPPPPLGLTMTDGGNQYDSDPPAPAPASHGGKGRPPAAREKAAAFIRTALEQQDALVVVDLCDRFIVAHGGSKDTFYRARDDLVEAGEIRCDGDPRRLHRKATP
jgi:hypothetical protein